MKNTSYSDTIDTSAGLKSQSAAVYIGVDPGLNGALAFYDSITGAVSVFDMPTKDRIVKGKNRRAINAVALGKLLDEKTHGMDVRAFVEQVNAMPGQGVTSMFTFGRNAGVMDGELGAMGVDPVYVNPRVWTKAMGFLPGADKDAHREKAARVFPRLAHMFTRKKDEGRADAALILAYGLMTEGEDVRQAA